MKFSVIPLFALLSIIPAVLAFPQPYPDPDLPSPLPERTISGDVEARELAKRDVHATVSIAELLVRDCPKKSCTTVGKITQGVSMSIRCSSNANPSPVGNHGWGLVRNTVGVQWVPLGGLNLDGTPTACA